MRLFYLFALFLMIAVNANGADILKLVNLLDTNETAQFKSMIVSPEDANAMRDDNNKTILMYASWIGNTEAVEYLIDKGAEPNRQDNGGVTALHLALWKSRSDIAIYLLKHGASPDIMSQDGMTPLDIANMRGNHQIADMIKNSAPKLKPLL